VSTEEPHEDEDDPEVERDEDAEIDEASEESFPASDPPATP